MGTPSKIGAPQAGGTSSKKDDGIWGSIKQGAESIKQTIAETYAEISFYSKVGFWIVVVAITLSGAGFVLHKFIQARGEKVRTGLLIVESNLKILKEKGQLPVDLYKQFLDATTKLRTAFDNFSNLSKDPNVDLTAELVKIQQQINDVQNALADINLGEGLEKDLFKKQAESRWASEKIALQSQALNAMDGQKAKNLLNTSTIYIAIFARVMDVTGSRDPVYCSALTYRIIEAHYTNLSATIRRII